MQEYSDYLGSGKAIYNTPTAPKTENLRTRLDQIIKQLGECVSLVESSTDRLFGIQVVDCVDGGPEAPQPDTLAARIGQIEEIGRNLARTTLRLHGI